MKLTVKVIVIQIATASSVPNQKIPSRIPVTLSADENRPHINKLFVSPAAWKIEPDEERMICIPTDKVSIWNIDMEGIHWSPKIISVTSLAVK